MSFDCNWIVSCGLSETPTVITLRGRERDLNPEDINSPELVYE